MLEKIKKNTNENNSNEIIIFKEEFEKQVKHNSSRCAVLFGNKELTYAELNNCSNQLARKLIGRGLTKEKCVVIIEERSIECIISIIAVLKSGGAFVIINSDLGEDRIRYIIKDCSPVCILYGKEQFDFELSISTFSVNYNDLNHEKSSNLLIDISENDLACIVYTSGSTGFPKGVMIEQHSIAGVLSEAKDHLGVKRDDIILQFSSMSFVAAMWDIVMTFLTGAALCIINRDEIMDVLRFEQFLTNKNVTIAHLPPNYLSQLNSLGVRILLTGGAVVYRETLSMIDTDRTDIYINYGSSETFGPVISWRFNRDYEWDKLPIGKPMKHVTAYILNGDRKCDSGEEGELCVTGEAVARGYLNQPELTKEKFIVNPFGKGMLFRTGDYGRYLDDGNIEYICRKDDQIKVNGFRVELAEIEYRLMKMDDVINVAVVCKKAPSGVEHICVYFTAERQIASREMKEYLSIYFPDYMIPDQYNQYETLPINHNGKIDKLKLRNMVTLTHDYLLSNSKTENLLLRILHEVLGTNTIERNDDLFEYGINSLQISRLINRIKKEFCKNLSYKEIFLNSIISDLAKLIDKKSGAERVSIPCIKDMKTYLMTSAQKRMYILSSREQNIAYNIPISLRIIGKIDPNKVRVAFQQIINRHEILRTTFGIEGSEAVQKVHVDMDINFKYITSIEDEEKLFNQFVQPYDLETGPLVRMMVVEQERTTLLFIDMHHIVSDGKSVALFLRELSSFYNGKLLEPLKIQYKDYSEWQRHKGVSGSREYWCKQFEGDYPRLDLPIDFIRPKINRFNGSTKTSSIKGDLYKGVKDLCVRFGVTEHMFFLSGLLILFSRYDLQNDFVIGIPVEGRYHKDVESLIGMFVNTIALRLSVPKNHKYSEFLIEVKKYCLEAYENQEFLFEDLIEISNINWDISRNPVFDVMLSVQDENDIIVDFDGVESQSVRFNRSNALFDISIDIISKKGEYEVLWEYNIDLFLPINIDYMLQHYMNLLYELIHDPDKQLLEYSMINKREYEMIVKDFNNTSVGYECSKCVHEVFEYQALRKKNSVAVVFDSRSITYGELNRKANQLAVKLRAIGLRTDGLVALIVNKSIDMIIGILGILKAGGAYVPIDAGYPKERIDYILNDSKPTAILTNQYYSNSNIPTIRISDTEEWREPDGNLNNVNCIENLAYIIYTSGTTGYPKGVMIEHRNLRNLINAYSEMYSLTEDDIIMQFASISFDQSVFEIFCSLLIGAVLCIIDFHKTDGVAGFAKQVNRNKVTVMGLTPFLIKELNPSDFPKVRLLESGGSEAEADVLEGWNIGRTIMNTYGPTETTVNATTCKYNSEYHVSVPIGRPMNNAQVYIQNADGRLCGIGVPGEICIAGAGVARGYLNMEELSKEKFYCNPYGEGKLYATGDLGRWRYDGQIEFMGRVDKQIKIRGYRVEIDEVESVIRAMDHINDCVVVAREGNTKEIMLYAYLISDMKVDINKIKEMLRSKLPEYMIPAYIQQIEFIPLNKNGKLEIKRLPEFIHSMPKKEEPQNETHLKLQSIFCDVLKLDSIGIYDSFFEFGGNSLNAIHLLYKISQEFEIMLTIKQLIDTKSIYQISILLEGSQEKQEILISRALQSDFFQITSAQKSIYFMNKIESGVTYNMPMLFKIRGNMDIERFRRAISDMIVHHEILRSSFKEVDGNCIQFIRSEVHPDFEYAENEKDITEIYRQFIRPFNLSTDILFRLKVVKQIGGMYLLSDFHHIVADARSIELFFRELSELYCDKVVARTTMQFIDYGEWMHSKNYDKEKQYWAKRFVDTLPVLNMPTDYIRGAEREYVGTTLTRSMSEYLVNKVRTFAAKIGTTEYIIYLTAFLILLNKYTSQNDIVVGITANGRTMMETQSMLGMFINTIPFRAQLDLSRGIAVSIKEIEKIYYKDLENQNFSISNLTEFLNINRDLSRNPMFDVMFNMYVEKPIYSISDEVQFINLFKNFNSAKFDICAEIIIIEDKYTLSWNFTSQLYQKDNMQAMMEHYLCLVDNLLDESVNTLDQVNMLPPFEKEMILKKFAGSSMEYTDNRCIQEIIDIVWKRNSENTAVILNDMEITYGELYKKSNQLANLLRNQGVMTNEPVAVLAERSIEMIISIFGIIRAGGVYVPIDPSYPDERIRYILEDCNPRIIVEYKSGFITDREIISIDNHIWEETDICSITINRPDDLIYIIYTSGTTGAPKGVLIEQRGIVSLCTCLGKEYGINPNDNILQFASISFDSSVWEIFMTLLNGATLCLIPEEQRYDINKVHKLMKDKEITVVLLPPQYLENVDCSSLRLVLSAGSAATYNLVKHIPEDVQYINEYGPTEGTVCSTYWRNINGKLKSNCKIPIGIPVPNKKIYIMKQNQLCGIGEPGELCIGGTGVAKGYLNQEEMTKEKFIVNPFGEGRIYKTGDLVRWLFDGNIEYLGRIDDQVKVRGFRVELKEIESVLGRMDDIRQCAVISRNDGDDVNIIAFVTCDKRLDITKIRNSLKLILPEYMLPTYIEQIDEIPITANGKADINKLLNITIKIGGVYEAPRNREEERLLNIFRKALCNDSIGVNDDFFKNGGHSLKAIKLIALLEEEFGFHISIKDIFKYPTVNEFYRMILVAVKKKNSPIKTAEQKEFYGMLHNQKEIYAMHHFGLAICYNVPIALYTNNMINCRKLEDALIHLFKRHEILRTTFHVINNMEVQRIHNEMPIAFTVEESDERKEKLLRDFIKPFDLSEGPLLRVKVVIQNSTSLLFMDIHHIIADQESIRLIFEELMSLYDGKDVHEIPAIQYKDFSEWTLQRNFDEQEKYWFHLLDDDIPKLNLITDYPRGQMVMSEGKTIIYDLPINLNKQIKRYVLENKVTEYMFFLSIFMLMLSNYARQEDIVVGSPISIRNHNITEHLIGMLVNTLLMRGRPKGNRTFKEFMLEMKDVCLSVFENREYYYEKYYVEHDTRQNILYDVVMAYEPYNEFHFKLGEAEFSAFDINIENAKFDITLTVQELADGYRIAWNYRSSLFIEKSMEHMVNHYIQLIETVLEDGNRFIKDIKLMNKTQETKLLVMGTGAIKEYQCRKCVHQIFDEQTAKTPNSIAVIYENERITYADLKLKADILAEKLISRGVEPEDFVGVMMERSIELIIAILGTMKSGAAYVPISPQHPVGMVDYILNDCNPKCLLVNGFSNKYYIDIINLSEDKIWDGKPLKTRKYKDSQGLMYAIYTSGTTGKQKAALIKHSSFVNLLEWYINSFSIRECDNIILLASICFDLAQKNVFAPLVSGGKLIMNSSDDIDYIKITDMIKRWDVSIINWTPSAFQALLSMTGNYSDLKSLRYIILGGEPINLQVMKKWVSSNCRASIVNTYGPTECTDIATCYVVKEVDMNTVPIGVPIQNVETVIVDRYNRLVPLGMPGELCITGVGVSKGYLNQPEWTNEKFIFHTEFGQMYYKTGDLVRLNEDGNIDFLGRIDQQVKIRGYRIELGEIEYELSKCENIDNCAVIAKEDSNGEKYLCAYVVSDDKIDIDAVKISLRKQLPGYMIPEFIMQIQRIPTTNNGKLNRKQLPDFNLNSNERKPKSIIEIKLARIFENILNLQNIGVDGNFFELGGNSLKVVKLVNKMEEVFLIRPAFSVVFENPTINLLSRYIERSCATPQEGIEIAVQKDSYVMSSTQKSIFVINSMENGTGYNMSVAWKVTGRFNVDRFKSALYELTKHHEALRTSFYMEEGIAFQKINDVADINLEYMVSEKEVQELYEEFIKPFILSQAPLLRMRVIRQKGGLLLFLDMHHIISDGISVSIMMEDLALLYNGNALTPLRVQYKDYSEWMKKRNFSRHRLYWHNIYPDIPQPLSLPLDYKRPLIQSFEGNEIKSRIDSSLAQRIRNFVDKNGITEYMLFLSVLAILLEKYSKQNDIVIGCPIAGRSHKDTESIIGMFVNTLPLRTKVDVDKSFSVFIHQIKDICLGAFENQDYPFERLIEEMAVQRDISRTPLFDVMLVLQNMDGTEPVFEDACLTQIDMPYYTAKFDITVEILPDEEGYQILWTYCTRIYREASMRRLMNNYIRLLSDALNRTDAKIRELTFISAEETELVLKKFNDGEFTVPTVSCVQELFEIKTSENPQKPAIIYKDMELSYGELDKRANLLAHILRDVGILPNDFVILITEHSPEMIIGRYGILKSGAAFVPVDPESPDRRIRMMLSDCLPKAIVLYGNNKLAERVHRIVDEVTHIVELIDLSAFATDDDGLFHVAYTPNNVNVPTDIAYMIYTSGTTGQPKGVMVEHGNVINFCMNRKKNQFHELLKNNCNYVYASNNSTFDIVLIEIEVPLSNGLTIILSENINEVTPGDLRKINNYSNIGFITTPTKLKVFMENRLFKEEMHNFTLMMVGSERFERKLYQKIRKYSKSIIMNGYGPTESTCGVTFARITDDGEEITIGTPIGNTQIYIMDDESLCAIGQPGEICIAGSQVARGYYNQNQLTDEKFKLNPFGDGKIYHSGDIGRWRYNGEIEFMGRKDQQVKIKGFRIELEEIESVIKKQRLVKDAVVVTNCDETGIDKIYAYVLSDEKIKEEVLIEDISDELPAYMIPHAVMQIDRIPLSSNGKTDKSKLPSIKETPKMKVVVSPVGIKQKVLLDIFKEILEIDPISVNESFFSVGGDSIKAIRIVSKLRVQGFETSVQNIMRFRTIERIAETLSPCNRSNYDNRCITGEVILSPIQHDFFHEWKMAKPENFYQSVMLMINILDMDGIHLVFNKLLEHHDMLRCIYQNGKQYIRNVGEGEIYCLKQIECKMIPDNEIIT